MIIRRATAADLPAIVAMLADDALGSAREALADPLPDSYAAAFARIDADPGQLLAVAELEGAVVGSFQLSFIPGLSYQGATRAVIEAVRVAGPLRGRGIGGAMLRWAIAESRRRGCRMLQLTSHASRGDAHRFYERLGFVKSHVGMKLEL